MEIVNKLETKISEIESRLKENVLNLQNQRLEVKKLKDEFKVLSGALQAFRSVISELKGSESDSEYQQRNENV